MTLYFTTSLSIVTNDFLEHRACTGLSMFASPVPCNT